MRQGLVLVTFVSLLFGNFVVLNKCWIDGRINFIRAPDGKIIVMLLPYHHKDKNSKELALEIDSSLLLLYNFLN